MNLIDRMAVNPDIQLMPEFLSSKHHVMGLLDIRDNLLTFSHVDMFVNSVFISICIVSKYFPIQNK